MNLLTFVTIMNKKLLSKESILLILLLITGGVIFYALSDLITSLLSAVVIYIISQPLMQYLIKRKVNLSVAAFIVIFLSVFLILIPISLISISLTSKLSSIINNPTVFFSSIENIIAYIEKQTGIQVITSNTIQKLQSFVTELATSTISAAANMILNTIIMYFILYYLLINSGKMQSRLNTHIPFLAQLDDNYAIELQKQTISNAIAIPIIAIVQGITCYIALLLMNYSDAGFWATMCGLFSFIPFVGTTIVWLPLGVSRIIEGDMWQGIVLLIYGFLIISQIDNVFRFIIQKKLADVHPLITVLGVLFGIRWFGISGLIFGPLLISYFLLLLRSYNRELASRKA